MSDVASAGQILRLGSGSQDFDLRVFSGPKRSIVQITNIRNGLGYVPPSATSLYYSPAGSGIVDLGGNAADAFPASGGVFINGKMWTYTSHDYRKLFGVWPLDNVLVDIPAGSTVSLMHDITSLITGIEVQGTLDGHIGTWTATLQGVSYDADKVDADYSILIQVKTYPDYPNLRVAQDSGGSWAGVSVGGLTVGWSGWKDLMFGYVVDGSVSKNAETDSWSARCEGTSQYLKLSTSSAKSFGRRDIAKRKTTKTSSVLANVALERVGSGFGEDEYYGSPDVSGTSAVDDDNATLWVSQGYPQQSMSQVESGVSTEVSGDRPYIDGISTRSPLPAIVDDYNAQWISFYNPFGYENRFRMLRGNGETWYQHMSICKWVPNLSTVESSYHMNDYDAIRIGKLLNPAGGDAEEDTVSIGSHKRVVFCYSKAHFHRIYGDVPDVTVVEWGRKYPNFHLNPDKDYIFIGEVYSEPADVVDPSNTNNTGHLGFGVRPLNYGWSTDPNSPEFVDGLYWGEGWPNVNTEGFPVATWRVLEEGSRNSFMRVYHKVPPLGNGQFLQRHVSGDAGSGFDAVNRFLLAQGTKRVVEWLRVDLGEFFTKLTKDYNRQSGEPIVVESTGGFAAAGRIIVDTDVYSYGSKTDTEFRDLALVGGHGYTHVEGSFVYQTDANNNIVDCPQIGAIQIRRPYGKSAPSQGEIKLSNQADPPDPFTDPHYAGLGWPEFWDQGTWKFGTLPTNYGDTTACTWEIALPQPVRARHILFLIEKQDNGDGGIQRAKINEITVLEPGVTDGTSGVSPDSQGRVETGQVIKHYLVSGFGLTDGEVQVERGVSFSNLDIAESDYWTACGQIAERTDHVLINNRVNQILYKPHPIYGLLENGGEVFFTWTDDNCEDVQLNILQSNRVGQIILRGRDTTTKRNYTVNYPSSPRAIGAKKTIDDSLMFGTSGLVRRAEKHFRFENRRHEVTWRTWIADEVDLGQWHVIQTSGDASGRKLNGMNVVITAVSFSIAMGDDGSKSWTTTCTGQELPL